MMKELILKYIFFLIIFIVCSFWFMSETINIIETVSARNSSVKMYKKMLNFLQLKLQKYPLSQWNNRIAEMKPGYSGYIKVLPISKINLSASEISKLKRKKSFVKKERHQVFLGIEGNDMFLYKIIPHSKYVFKTNTFSLNKIAHYLLAWNNKLITMELYNTPQKNWNKIAEKIQKIYGYPLSIISKTDPRLSVKELSNLQNYDTTIEETKKEEVRNFYSKIPGTNFLIHTGPIPIDYFGKYEDYIIYAAFLFVLLCFLFVSHIFFGRAIRKIFIITDHYSRGDFNVTTKLSKYSSMYKVYANILEMGQRIKGLIKSQQALTRLVAHESRTPISRMLFIIENMEKLQHGDKLQQNVADLKENLNELNDLTNNFLRYSRLTSKQLKLDLKETNIVNLIKMSIKKYISNKQNIKISTTFNLSKIEQAMVDKKYMGYALDNLIDNAIRYAKSQIKISVWNTTEKLFIAIEDDGIIIHNEDKKNIFEPFIQIKQDHNALTEGYGLGLSIVKAIIDLHHGTIEVFDSALEGTKFLITLPIQSKH